MYGIIHFEVFLLSAVLFVLTPGIDTMYVIGRSLSKGKLMGIYSALGVSAGVVIHTLLAAFGLSIILTQSVLMFTVIKVAGAIYLAYLGINMILTKNKKKEEEQTTIQSNKKAFIQGLITNVTNPKVAIFFLAFLPQFIQTGSGIASPIPFIILGVTYTIISLFWLMIAAYLSSMATKKLHQNSKFEVILNKLTGFIFIAMSIKLFKTNMSS